MLNRTLFLTLRVFSVTGGVERVCRVAGKALYEMTLHEPAMLQVFSMHDDVENTDNKYFPSEIFRGFGGMKAKFVMASVAAGLKSDVIILSHINLIVIGWLIKKLAPAKKIILFAHGIEVWQLLSKRKKKMLRCCSQVFAVSNFTAAKLQELHGFPAEKCTVINNCLDPFLPVPSMHKKAQLLQKYGYTADDFILFSLTRLSSKERYKGYDKVMEAITTLKPGHPALKYFLAGTFDKEEKKFVDSLKKNMHLEQAVYLPGYLPDEELGDHFAMSDVYIMPSIKEGFGIVFIEAVYYGVPVIAGNVDGSVDALCNGALGLLVNPDDQQQITGAIQKLAENRNAFIPDRALLLKKFSYDTYKKNLEKILTQLN